MPEFQKRHLSKSQETQELSWLELSWERKEDEDWAEDVVVRLEADYNAPDELCDQVLLEVHEVVGEEGRSARELFGDPDTYARIAADERISEARRARTAMNGRTPGERLSRWLFFLGWFCIVGFGFEWTDNGLWAEVSWFSVAGFGTFGLAWVLVAFAFAAHGAGRLRGAWGFAAGAVGVVSAGLAIAHAVPDERLFSVPRPVLMLVCLAWIVGVETFPEATLDRWLAHARDKGDNEAWFSRLGALLRGRHAMTAAEARGHVQEARQHLAASAESASAADAFGDVEVYAHRLAEGPRKQRRLARREAYAAGFVTLVLAVWLVGIALGSAPPGSRSRSARGFSPSAPGRR